MQGQNRSTNKSCGMLHVRRAMIQELIENDSLLVIAKGLGLFEVLSAFLLVYSQEDSRVLLINAPKAIQTRLERSLRAQNCRVPARSINTEFTKQERLDIYKQGGCICITSRILTVDLLDGSLLPRDISGIVVWGAHRLTENCNEAFILRLFRQGNREGFIKALSDAPGLSSTSPSTLLFSSSPLLLCLSISLSLYIYENTFLPPSLSSSV